MRLFWEGGSYIKLSFTLCRILLSHASLSWILELYLVQVISCPCSSDSKSITDGGFSEWVCLCLSGQVYQLRPTILCLCTEDATVLPHVVEMGRSYYAVGVIRAYTCGHMCFSPLLPSSLPHAHICMAFGNSAGLNIGWSQWKITFPCWALTYGVGTQSLSELKNVREQTTLFPWSCKLQPPCAVHIKYQFRPPPPQIINQLGHGAS